MTFINLMNTLNERAVRLQREGSDLIILGEKDTLTSALLSKLSAYKAELLDLVDRNNGDWRSSGFIITPEMLPLVELSAAEIEKIVNTAPGGAANVQDIYPLAPLQEGILFHHQISTEGDPYLTQDLYAIDSRGRLEAFLKALQAVIDRHDILRTALQWEGLREPVQVVWRQAPLIVEEISIDQGAGDVARQLAERFNPRSYRIDIRQAPMMRVYIAHDEPNKRWVMACLYHHVAVDHMTMEVLQEEILAHMQGRVDRLPAPLPFRNFVAQARMGVSQEEHESFFREMLGDVDEPTAPYGLIDVHGDGSDVREAWRKIDAAPANRLRLTSRALGVSAASLCHLAWALALRRVLGRDDVVFGTVVFGRMHGGEGADRAPGMMMNTLPIRIRLGAASVEESARQTHQWLAELMRHEHASLALAQKCSGVAAPAPLFSSLLNYRHSPRDVAPAPEMESAGMGIQQLKGEERTNYPLVMSITDLGDGFRLTAQAAAPADPLRVCELMRTALERLAEALERAPETPARAIDALPEAERRQLVEEWNATEADYPAARSRAAGSRQESLIHELFEDQVEKNPHAVAVVYEDQSLTYGELNLRANRLAWRLRELGVGPEARVAICMERSLEMVVALLATLKAGGAYVPLDPDYPGERLAYMLEESAPAVLLTHGAASRALSGSLKAAPTLDLEMDEAQWAGQSEQNPERSDVGSDARSLAYIIYTSGSTGLPKGAMNEHSGVVNRLMWMQEAYGLGAGEAVLQKTPFSFDVSVWEFFWPLLNGVRLVMALPGGHQDPGYLARKIREQEVSTAHFVPSMLQAFLEQAEAGECRELMRVVCSGEALPAALSRRFYERLPETELHNLYGPTEAAVDVTAWNCAEKSSGKGIPIGRPVSNTRIYVLDEEWQPAPIGVGGGIYIGGAQVGRGYDGRPEMTAAAFLPDPFSREQGSRMYKTGDVGRWLSEGAIEFLGRNDNQVKIRGYRIELGEIEAKLSSHGGVREAVVAPREEGEVGKMLVAYYTGAEVGAEALRVHLSSSLPEYMVPAAYVHLERLPLTPNGKLDRRALPAPDVKRAEERDGYLGPRTPVEEIVVGIFEEVLKLDRVGRRENFFELGGHSLSAAQVVSRIRKMSGVEIGVRSVFEEGTVEGLARKIEEAMRAGEKVETPPLAPVERESERGRRAPLSFAQQRLWFTEQLEPGNTLYNIPGGVRLEGSLNVEALEGAINEIVRRHEVLRTRIEVEEGEPFQVIDEWEPRRLEVENLSGMAVEERAREVKKAVKEEAGKGFDLSREPLMRVKLLKLEEEEHVALFTMHHIISDAWSMGVLVRELCLFYEARSKGLESPLPELDIQYADYASWQRNYLSGEALEEHLRYWRKQLGVKPQAVNLAGDHPRPSVPSDRGAVKSLSLPADLYGSMKSLSKREGATMFMVLLAAFKTLLHKYTAQDDILVGTSALNRNRMEIEPLIGFFVNMLPMKTNFGGNPRFREILRRVKMVALGAYTHQDLPFEKLVEEIQPERKLGQMPLFNIVFGVFNAPQEEMRLSGLKVSSVAGEDESARLDLSLWITEGAGTVRAVWTYSTDLFEEETIVRMHRHFETLLSIVVAQPDVPLDQIEILSEAERIQQSASRIAREEYNYSRFKNVKPRAVALSED